MKQYKEFTTIKANYKKDILTDQKKFKNEIISKDENSLKNLYIYRQLTNKQKEKTLKEIKKFLIDKRIKEDNKRIEKFFKHCDDIAQTSPAKTIKIEVNWAKNRTWGSNPTAEVWSAGEYTRGRASGCGYDKLSSAIGEALNKNKHILNILLNAYEKELRKNKNISMRDAVGYGCDVWGFDYGVGYSSFKNIFDTLGAKINTWHDGKNWDSMQIEF